MRTLLYLAFGTTLIMMTVYLLALLVYHFASLSRAFQQMQPVVLNGLCGDKRTIFAGSSKSSSISSAEDRILPVGATKPFGVWDPANVIENFDENSQPAVYKSFQEAELKHGRVCMIAALGVFMGEKFPILFDGAITGTAVEQYDKLMEIYPTSYWLITWLIGMIEFQVIIDYWKPGVPRIGEDYVATGGLKDNFIIGDYGFDPLRIKPKTESALLNMKNKEINNGRLGKICLLIDIDHFRR